MPRMIEFEIQNFRQYETSVRLELDPITLLIGANNSGKTAVLQALALFQYCLEACIKTSGRENGHSQWSFKKTENMQPEQFGPLPVSTQSDLWPHGKMTKPIVLTARYDGGASVKMEIKTQYNLFNVKPTASGFDDTTLDELLRKSAIRLIPIFSGLQPSEEFLVSPARRERQLALRYGDIVRNLLLNLKKESPNRFRLLCRLLDQIYPATTLDVTYDEELAQRRVSARIESAYKDDNLDKTLDLIVAGSGMHQVVQIFAGLLQPDVSMGLLDEPDAHLHARLQSAMMDALTEIATGENLQFVIATHSPQLLRAAPASAIRICKSSRIINFKPGPDQLELLDDLGVMERMELVPLLQGRRMVFVENRDDRKLIELFAKQHRGQEALSFLNRITFLYTYQEPISSGVLQKARQINDLFKEPDLLDLGGKSSIKFLAIGDRDYRDDEAIADEIAKMETKSQQNESKFDFRLRIWQRNEIENYLLDQDASLRSLKQDVESRNRLDEWEAIENEFIEVFDRTIQQQREQIIERKAGLIQQADRRLDLTAAMKQSREYFETRWTGNGTSWCDAKVVIAELRKWVQAKGLSPGSLSQARIIQNMQTIPTDMVQLIEELEIFSRPEAKKLKQTNKKTAKKASKKQ